jgi:hypothetical protein
MQTPQSLEEMGAERDRPRQVDRKAGNEPYLDNDVFHSVSLVEESM